MPETPYSSFPRALVTITESLLGLAEKMRGTAWAWISALLWVALALAVRFMIAPADDELRYVTFFPAISLAALLGGFGPGMLSVAASILCANILIHPLSRFTPEALEMILLPDMIFFSGGMIVSASIELMHRYRQKFAQGHIQARNASTALARTESKYHHVLNNSIDGIYMMDMEGNLLEANEAFCNMLGYSQQELAGLNAADWATNISTEELLAELKKNFGLTSRIETRYRRKDGSLLDVEISISLLMFGEHSYVVATSRDISEHKRMESELRNTNEHLRELVANYEIVLEAERKEIAREVHDELGQVLSALRLSISMIRSRFGKYHVELTAMVQNMMELVDRAIHGVRNVSENLRPAVIEIGIFVSIKWLCDNFTEHSGIPCAMASSDPGVELDEARAVMVFRIVQESLTNVMRHAQAKNVYISLAARDGNLCVEVTDDGVGFEPKATRSRTSYGLFGMAERARAQGGELEVNSVPGQGTTISLRIPIKQDVKL